MLEYPKLYMQRCLDLALLGNGYTSPNPMVGAVLVYQNRIIGEGYHQQYGQAHAEVNCIQSVHKNDSPLIPDSTLYVSLEPCAHTGKTPPCTDLILKEGIKKIVVACRDKAMHVNGKGIDRLRNNGVEVIESILESEAQYLNRRFFTFHQKQRPYIILKWAQTTDRFIGHRGQRTKITNENTNKITHQWRHEESAIWVGFNTVQVDNSELNVRTWKGKNPIRIVFDANCALSQDLKIFNNSAPTFIFNTLKNETQNLIQWIKINQENYLQNILNFLHTQNVLSVIIEGGTKLLQQFIDQNLWDEARVITANFQLYDGVHAPSLPENILHHSLTQIQQDRIAIYHRQNNL